MRIRATGGTRERHGAPRRTVVPFARNAAVATDGRFASQLGGRRVQDRCVTLCQPLSARVLCCGSGESIRWVPSSVFSSVGRTTVRGNAG
eukprot:COSAG02_NODE_7169_length_3139_cov_1.525329_4_plen_90_part_00